MKIISKLMTFSIAGACMCTIIGALSNTAQAVSIQENEDTSAVTMVVSGKTDSTATTAITDATSYEDTYETTTATTAAQHTRERTKSVTVSVVDAETGKKMPDIDVELVKCFTVKVNGIIEISGEKEVLDSWNTTETSVYQSGKYAYDSEKPYYLAALIEKIPDGYIYRNHSDYALFAVGWDFTENTDETYDIVIELQKDPADEKYPLTGSYSAKISFGNVYLGRNYTEAELAELGLNCTLSDTCTDEVIQTWNTKDHAYITIENLEYDFQSYAAADNRYLLTIANLPDEYAIHDTNINQISVGIKIDAALNSDETIPMIIWLRNDSIDEPYITSITSTEITTTTTIVTDTTATAASGSESFTTTAATDATTTTISEIASTTTTTTTTNVTNTDLPQTGNNSKTNILIAVGALLLTVAGAWAMSASGILRRKEDA